MPLDDLSVSDDLRRAGNAVDALQPVDRSSNLAKALSAGDIASKVPGALATEEQQATEKRGAAQDTVRDLERDQAQRGLLKAPLPPAPEKPPEQPQTNPANAWGSIAMAVAMLGSGFTRRPLTNALNAGAQVMNAYRQKDVDAYKRSFESWKAQTDYGLKLYEYQHDAYKDALDMIDRDEKGALAKLRVLASALNDDPMKRLAEAGNISGAVELERQREVGIDKTRTETDNLHAIGQAREAELDAYNELTQAQKSNDPNAVAAAQQKLKEAQDRAKIVMQNPSAAQPGWDVLLDPANKDEKGNPTPYRYNKSTGEATTLDLKPYTPGGAQKVGTGAGGATITQDAADLIADEFLAGNKQATVGMARSAANMGMVSNAIAKKAKERGMSGEAVAAKQAEFQGLVSGERTLGTLGARLGTGLAEANIFAPIALELSDKVPRTEYKSLNSLLLAAEAGTGDETVVRYGVALNAMISAYSQVLVRGGTPTDAARDQAREAFDKAYSKGQIKGLVDQIMIEIKGANKAPGIVQKEMSDRFTGKSTPPSAAPAGGGTVIQYDAQGNRVQ